MTFNAGYDTVFTGTNLTVGLYLPAWPYRSHVTDMAGHGNIIERADALGFAGLWVRDIPVIDSSFGDIGQVFDPLVYLTWAAGRTRRIALCTGSLVLPLHSPIDVAKQVASLDQLSNGRVLLGVASGDRRREFDLYGAQHSERSSTFRDHFDLVRAQLNRGSLHELLLEPENDLQVVPKSFGKRIALIPTGSSRQSIDWLASHADAWLTYPGPTRDPTLVADLRQRVVDFRSATADPRRTPVATNEWIDLVADPNHPPEAVREGKVLRTGTRYLRTLLDTWQNAGVDHAILGLQFSNRNRIDILHDIAESILPHFPSGQSLPQPDSRMVHW